MKLRPVRRTGRAALAAAALVLAGCGAETPLSPAAASAQKARQHEEARQGGGDSRASIYVIGSGRSQDAGE